MRRQIVVHAMYNNIGYWRLALINANISSNLPVNIKAVRLQQDQ